MNTTIKIALASDSIQGRSGAINHIYPAPNEVSLNDRLFIVSAGMGDTEHANHFAQIICQTFQQKISRATGLNTQRLGQVFVNDTLRQAEREIQKYLIQYPRLKDVLGVMALAYFNTDGSIALAWVGNCRAYHIRNGKVLYQTEDHLANLMQDNKVVVIPRAINGIEPAWQASPPSPMFSQTISFYFAPHRL
jgi:serine/threonine protein phosphatase PrpC